MPTISTLHRFLAAAVLAGCLLSGPTRLRAEAPDLSGYFEESRAAKSVSDRLSSFTLDEAKQCVAALDTELQRDPGNQFLSGLRTTILSVFRTSYAVEKTRSEAEAQMREVQKLENQARDAMKPSPLTGQPNTYMAGTYERKAAELRRQMEEAPARAEQELLSCLKDALEFASFCRERGRGQTASKVHQLARLKGGLLSSGHRLEWWNEEAVSEAAKADRLVEDSLARSSKALVEKRYFEIDQAISEALSSAPSNPWLLQWKRTSDDAVKRSGEMLGEAKRAQESKQYETAAEFLGKSLAIAADNGAALGLKGEIDTILREKTGLLAKAATLEEGGELEEAYEIYERYAQTEDFQRVARRIAQAKEKAGDFIGAHKYFKIAGDSVEILRTQTLMAEQSDAYQLAESHLAGNQFDEARRIFEKYGDKEALRGVALLKGRRSALLGDTDKAMELFREARAAADIAALARFLEEQARSLSAAQAAEASGDLETALAHYESAGRAEDVRRISLQLADKMEKAELYGSAIDYYERAGDPMAAARLRGRIPPEQAASFSKLSPKEIFARCNPACLTIFPFDRNGKLTGGLGSGFFVARGGYVLTNRHVVGTSRIVSLRLSDGRQSMATVVDSSEEPDLALLKTDIAHHAVINLGKSSLVETGDPVSVIGTPFVVELSSTLGNGHIAAVDRSFRNNDVFQIDATINHGNSGGPLLNDRGQAIGVNTFGLGDLGAQGLNFSIKIDEALDMLRRNHIPGF